MSDRNRRDDDPHDDVIPGPTDDTYKDSDRTAGDGPVEEDAAPGTHPERGRGHASPDELADDAGERRFDYS